MVLLLLLHEGSVSSDMADCFCFFETSGAVWLGRYLANFDSSSYIEPLNLVSSVSVPR